MIANLQNAAYAFVYVTHLCVEKSLQKLSFLLFFYDCESEGATVTMIQWKVGRNQKDNGIEIWMLIHADWCTQEMYVVQ